MQPRFEILPQKKFVGKSITMSYAENKTIELWRSFMPRRMEIKNVIGSELYSIEVYSANFFDSFNPQKTFEKWAAVEVSDFDNLPDGMQTLTSAEGLYAVFVHKGTVSDGPKTYGYIFQTWLPNSGYVVDERPHFAIMGDKYKNNDPNSEEEIWIPVKSK